MKLQEKFALYNAITKFAIILVMGLIILLSIDPIAYQHSDKRLLKKYSKLVNNLNDKDIDSLLKQNRSFTDYNILKDEYIILTILSKNKTTDTIDHFKTEERDVKGDTELYRILTKNFNYNGESYNLELGLNTTSTYAIKYTLRQYLLLVLILSLLITLIIDFSFSKILLKPFYNIINQKLSNVNHPDYFNYAPIPTNTSDFVFLDENINSMMLKISELFQLEKQFIANVSHELITPISILNSRLENMLLSNELSPNQEDKISASLKTLSKLKSIINSLLLISKIENEQFKKEDDFILKQEIEEVIDELEERILSKKIHLEINLKENYHFRANQSLINILFTNIINNAIKYNKAQGYIHIKDEIINQQYTISIEDSGIGMNTETQSIIFNRFERGKSHNEIGLGLGLSIAQSIAKFHQITLKISSIENRGTVFKIIFHTNRISS